MENEARRFSMQQQKPWRPSIQIELFQDMNEHEPAL